MVRHRRDGQDRRGLRRRRPGMREIQGVGSVDWKSYYRRELTLAESRGRLVEWLEAGADGRVDAALRRGAVVSFPHTAMAYAGPLQAAVVSSLYRGGVESVIALGVLHSGSLPIYQCALDERRSPEERARAFDVVCGAFGARASAIETPFGRHPTASNEPALFRTDQAVLPESEFSLDTFVSIMRLAADVFGKPPIPVELVFVGMTRHPVTGSFEEARSLADRLRRRVSSSTAIVATGDLVHYGTAYGLSESDAEDVDSTDLERTLRSELETTLDLATNHRDLEGAYQRSRHVLMNDQRELLAVIVECLGERSGFEIIRLGFSDYTEILSVPPPCLVASALVVYGCDA